MKVIIKEDNSVHQTFIKDQLIRIQITLDVQFDIIISNDIKEILNYNSMMSGVINIIDIIDEFDHSITGVDIAKSIKETNPSSHIIFMTSYDHFIKEAVNSHIEPIAYINKTDVNLYELLLNVMQKIIYTKSIKDIQRVRFVDENKDINFINIENILLIQTHPLKQKYVEIYTKTNTYNGQGKIKDFIGLSSILVQVNKSCLINKNQIKKIAHGTSTKNKRIFLQESKQPLPDIMLTNKYKHNLF